MAQKAAPSLAGLISWIFSETVIVICIVIGALLMWISALVGTFGGAPALQATVALRSTGMALIGTMLTCGGIANPRMDRAVRVVAIILGVLLLMALIGARLY